MTATAVVGSAAPATAPTATLMPWMNAAATTRPSTTGRAAYRVAKARMRSWLLSPNSATNTAPKARATAARNGSMRWQS